MCSRLLQRHQGPFPGQVRSLQLQWSLWSVPGWIWNMCGEFMWLKQSRPFPCSENGVLLQMVIGSLVSLFYQSSKYSFMKWFDWDAITINHRWNKISTVVYSGRSKWKWVGSVWDDLFRTSLLQNCRHNTAGDHCEKCRGGFHGDTTVDGHAVACSSCPCPLQVASNKSVPSSSSHWCSLSVLFCFVLYSTLHTGSLRLSSFVFSFQFRHWLCRKVQSHAVSLHAWIRWTQVWKVGSYVLHPFIISIYPINVFYSLIYSTTYAPLGVLPVTMATLWWLAALASHATAMTTWTQTCCSTTATQWPVSVTAACTTQRDPTVRSALRVSTVMPSLPRTAPVRTVLLKPLCISGDVYELNAMWWFVTFWKSSIKEK